MSFADLNRRPVRLRRQLAAFVILLLALAPLVSAEKVSDIQPTGYVIDLANVIDPATRAKISAMATELQEKTGAQIAVVTVNSLEGEAKENYAADLYKHLGIGPKKTDEGVLLLVAPKERQYRIEVGYGLEPVINDARAGDVGRSMAPQLKAGDYSGAALNAMTQIAQMVAAAKGVQLTGLANRGPSPAPRPHMPWWVVFGAIFVVFSIIRAIIRRGGGGPGSGLRSRGFGVPPVVFLPGGWGGGGGFGGSSGGFGGGGGFGGFGGGMSGGGGAGGSW